MPAILVVEDESAITDTIVYALESEGFAVHRAALALEARNRLRTFAFDLVILDIGLPDTRGLEFLREIRASHDKPVLLLTARSAEIDRVLGLELGADDYVTKPFSPRELVARVCSILRRVNNATPDSVKLVETPLFRVDDAMQRIWFAQALLDLTRYEYLLLKVLLRSR